jgi:hypothetical protein
MTTQSLAQELRELAERIRNRCPISWPAHDARIVDAAAAALEGNTTEAPRRYRVEIAYRFRKKKTGVLLGMTVEAENEDDAVAAAIAKHVTPYKARVLVGTTVERAST